MSISVAANVPPVLIDYKTIIQIHKESELILKEIQDSVHKDLHLEFKKVFNTDNIIPAQTCCIENSFSMNVPNTATQHLWLLTEAIYGKKVTSGYVAKVNPKSSPEIRTETKISIPEINGDIITKLYKAYDEFQRTVIKTGLGDWDYRISLILGESVCDFNSEPLVKVFIESLGFQFKGLITTEDRVIVTFKCI